jgi:hypothetical protein
VGSQDEVQRVLIAGSGLYGTEIPRFPFDAVGLAYPCLFSLAILDLELFVRGRFLVAPF